MQKRSHTHSHMPMCIQAPTITLKAYWEEYPPSTPLPSPNCSMAHAACMVCCLRWAANFSPCGSLISASHNCPLIRSNRFFSLGINCVFSFPKNISFSSSDLFFYLRRQSSDIHRIWISRCPSAQSEQQVELDMDTGDDTSDKFRLRCWEVASDARLRSWSFLWYCMVFPFVAWVSNGCNQ